MILDELKPILERLTEIKNTAYSCLQDQANAVRDGHFPTESECERLLDSFLDYCDDERFFNLYKETCRKLYPVYPELVVEHVIMYRNISILDDGKEDI